ncbi:MAG: hypothetical protein KY457_02665 [Actinobacteria bacterium]|nr:hypothetical protein [Actinomycetota bacterium]
MRPEDTQTPPTEPQPATSTTRSTTATADRDGFTADDGVGAFQGDSSSVLADDERSETERRWEDIEARFVDDPAGATKDADDLLGETMDRIAQRWHDRRSQLREGWDDEDASTEQLRTTLKRYRSALQGLLSR